MSIKKVVSITVIIWLIIVLWGGKAFDDRCIKGKLTADDVAAMGHYAINDRIFSGSCSEFFRMLHLRDWKGLDGTRKWIQKHIKMEYN